MQNKIAITVVTFFLFCTMFLAFSIDSTSAAKPDETRYKKGKGKLITEDGLKFTYKFYPASVQGPTVIYIPGMGGKTNKDVYQLASPLNQANFNFIAFDRAGALSGGSLKEHNRNAKKRSKSGAATYPSIDGKESTAQNVVRNEIKSILKFIENAPTYNPEKGIYLIGESWGSLISLDAIQTFPKGIKGVVFLSPSIVPKFVSPEFEEKYKKYNFDVVNYWKSLVKSYGDRPGLAIGGKKDIIAPHLSKKGSALDSANLLRKEIGTNIEVVEVSTSDHGGKLIKRKSKVKEIIVRWLTGQVSST